MEQLGINPIFLLSQIVNFAILAIGLGVLAYRPVLNVLDKRKERIEKGLEDARLAEEARANAESERQKMLDEARAEAQTIVSQAGERGEEQAATIIAEAREEARRILDNAHKEAEAERDRSLSEMRGQIAGLAIAAANRVIGESLDMQRQMQLVEEFFSGIKAGKVTVLEEAEALVGAKAQIVSALPLSDADEALYHTELQSRLGPDAQITFKTDPTILGGVVLRVGDKVVDDSVSGRLESLHGRLT